MKRTKRAMDKSPTFVMLDACGGRPKHQEEETWSDHSSVTLDQHEKELVALKGNKGEIGGKGGKGNWLARILHLLWKICSSFE